MSHLLNMMTNNENRRKKAKIWWLLHWKATLAVIGAGAGVFIAIMIIFMAFLMTAGESPSNSGCSSGGGSSVSMTSIAGASGSWTHKGTKEYNASKDIFASALNQGLDAKHASALLGNGLEESGMFGESVGQSFSTWPHQSSGPGEGIFMFTPGLNIPSDKSIPGQVKAIMRNDLRGTKSSFEHASGSISELTEDFRADFEGGDINQARQDYANKAYQVFGGMKGGSTSSDASGTANSGGGSCGDSDSSAGASTDVIKFGDRYLGLGYLCPSADPEPIVEGKPKSEADPSDCNVFAWACYKHCGYDVPSSMPGDCDDSIARLHKYEIPASKAKAGDLVVNHYHAMILEQSYRGDALSGPHSTKVLQEGPDAVTNDHTIGWAMSGFSYTNHFFHIPKK